MAKDVIMREIHQKGGGGDAGLLIDAPFLYIGRLVIDAQTAGGAQMDVSQGFSRLSSRLSVEMLGHNSAILMKP
jgi:hypothetical protein